MKSVCSTERSRIAAVQSQSNPTSTSFDSGARRAARTTHRVICLLAIHVPPRPVGIDSLEPAVYSPAAEVLGIVRNVEDLRPRSIRESPDEEQERSNERRSSEVDGDAGGDFARKCILLT